MKTILLVMTAILSALAVRGDDATKESEAWHVLGKGKGVCVAKVKKEEAVAFVFFPATNRVRPTSTLNSVGPAFPSLDAAITFLKKKPSSISVHPASHDSLVDDAKILLELSATELKALTAAAPAPSKKEPDRQRTTRGI